MVSEKVTAPFEQFYLDVGSRFLGPPLQLLSKGAIVTVPIDSDTIRNSLLILEVLKREYDRWSEQPDLVIIDLTNPPQKLPPDHHVMGGVLAVLDAFRVAGKSTRFLLLMSEILPKDDVAMRLISEQVDQGRLGIIADDGFSFTNTTFGGSLNRSEYKTMLAGVRESNVSLLKTKMIRRIGHFVRRPGDNHDYCLLDFFDGSKCQDELIQLISDYARHIAQSVPNLEIFYHAPISSWLYEAVYVVATFGEYKTTDLEEIVGRPARTDITVPNKPLIILPLVDTRATLNRILRKLRELNPSCNPTILTVMTTSPFLVDDNRMYYELDGVKFDIKSLLRVTRSRLPKGECELCQANIPETLPNQPDRYLTLTTHAMWSMILESGFVPERDPPWYRKTPGLVVPDLLTVIGKNSAYLATKIDRLFRHHISGLPSEPIVLFPAETVAKELAKCLVSMFRYTLIPIPREVLKEFDTDQDRKPSTTVGQFDEHPDRSPWKFQMKFLSDRKERDRARVILLDEFRLTDGTRKSLVRFAQTYDLEVLCYFCMVTFSPFTPSDTGELALSLYEMDYQFG